jgi:hypothetical protein
MTEFATRIDPTARERHASFETPDCGVFSD